MVSLSECLDEKILTALEFGGGGVEVFSGW
jgi:hypothetical protein